jgi:hypothetical protein
MGRDRAPMVGLHRAPMRAEPSATRDWWRIHPAAPRDCARRAPGQISSRRRKGKSNRHAADIKLFSARARV